jgi:hypothetical protein
VKQGELNGMGFVEGMPAREQKLARQSFGHVGVSLGSTTFTSIPPWQTCS